VVGLGGRGTGMLRDVIMYFDDVVVTAVCDVYEDRVERASKMVEEKYGQAPFATTNYKEVFERKDIDAVYIPSSWETHLQIAIDALRHGIIAAVEVGCAYDLNECYELVKAYEETGTPFMFMENCCFGKDELLATAMARAGKFGTVVNCHGAYSHDLREEITHGNVNRHYRLRNYTLRNTENYPTHELGPIARLLNINRGNRMMTLCAMSSKACGLKEYVQDNHLEEIDPALKDREFHQGDVVDTIIKCANGETITLRLDTTLPHSYSREFTVRGTKGRYEQSTNTVFLDGDKEYWEPTEFYGENLNNAKKFEEEFLPKEWASITPEEIEAGHGGMDTIMFRKFLDCIQTGSPMPIDVYDAVSWLSVSVLAEQSISMGGAVLAIPDFTHGQWILNKPFDVLD